MSSIPKKYVTLGLRRERNLSDTEVPETALNSLLDNLVNEPTGNFLSEDLDAIRGIQNTNITSTRLSELAGITVTASSTETIEGTPVIVDRVLTPLITLNDRLENAKIVTGEIPAIQGGDGLLARFIPSADINVGSKSSTGDNIFVTRPEQNVELFWDNGYFNFPSFIDPSFEDQYGGIQWTGYFTPSLRDPDINIVIFTAGLFIFEIDPTETNSWITVSSLYSDVRTLTTVSANGFVDQVTLAAGEIKFVAVGDIVNVANDVTVSGVNLSTSVVTFSSQTLVTDNQITLRKTLGQTITRSVVNLPPIELGKQIKIRFSFWFPDNGEPILEKYLDLQYIGSQLRFTNLYSTKPNDPPEEFEIRQFLVDAVSPYQNKVGQSLDNKNVYFNNSILLTYSPNKTSLNSIRTQGPVSVTFNTSNNIISGTMPNVEVGNILVPVDQASPINSIVRIKDTISSNVRVVDNNIGLSQAISVNIVDHRGFISWYRATSSGSIVTLISGSTSDLTVGMLIVTSASNGYIRIIEINSPSTFTTSSNVNLTGTEIIYVYSDKSLIDKSKDVFCNGVFGQVVSVDAPQGATQLTLSSVSGVADGQYIQFDGIIPSNTQVVGPPVGNVITISNALTVPLSSSNTVVFVPQALGGVINREGCVIPLNTAPPFSGTTTGLSTSGKGIKTDVGITDLSVTANFISANILSGNTTTTTDTTFDRKLAIKAKIGNTLRSFSVLSKSS
jgi:hypothetical protein